MVRCMAHQETRGGQRLKLYADTQGKTLESAVVQMTWNVLVFVQYWAGVEVARVTVDEMAHVVEVPSMMEKYLFVDCRWFGQIASNEPGAICDCFIARLNIGKGTELLENPTIQLRAEDTAE